ncbi:EamA family transporter [bacterium]|nr:EamA family transporter [bacterium]
MNPFIINIAIITLLDLSGTLCAKFYSINKNPLLLIATIMLFGSAGYVFAKSLKYEGMAITNILWIALSVVAVTILGYFIFKEEISNIQLTGIGVIIIGLILINLK